MKDLDGKRFEKDVILYNKVKNGLPLEDSEEDERMKKMVDPID